MKSSIFMLFISILSIKVMVAKGSITKDAVRRAASVRYRLFAPIHNNLTNILAIGLDAPSKQASRQRADVLIFARVDKTTGQVSLVSIPRDTRVDIPGYWPNKINAAYVVGGPELTVKCVEGLLEVGIDRYVVVDFEGFKKIVDELGGVRIKVEKKMDYEDKAGNLRIHLSPGHQHLDGEEALGYVRYRLDGDLERIKRQQNLIWALANKLLQPKNFIKLPQIIYTGYKAVETNFSLYDVLSLGFALIDKKPDLKAFRLPGRPAQISGRSYFIADSKKLTWLAQK